MSNTIRYGTAPKSIGHFDFDLTEVMHYLYLPILMPGCDEVRLPGNLKCCWPMIDRILAGSPYSYAYITARKGFATADNPLNRPGWHSDGFGTLDTNYIWWTGPGTRFAVQEFNDISEDHIVSMQQFEQQVDHASIVQYPEKTLLELTPAVIHATPLIEPPGTMRQFIKISLSDHQYNLENNSHNYLFDYCWKMSPRDTMRNDPHSAQKDFTERP